MMVIKGIEFHEVKIMGNGYDTTGEQQITLRGVERKTGKVFMLTYNELYGEPFDMFNPVDVEFVHQYDNEHRNGWVFN